MIFLEILLACVLLGWLALGALTFWNMRGATVLEPGQAAELFPQAPGISILVPARNEERTLAEALESFLRLDYPNYDVILVDDDSTDHTGEIAERCAQLPESAGRLKVIHNRDLPSGWRGKVHTLHLAAQAATGEWLLATDADVIFHPQILRMAMSCALHKDAQLVSLLPEIEFGSFAERVVLPAFSFLLALLFPLRLVNNPESSRSFAAGGFILMRRDDFEALGGYASLRDVVIEDLGTSERFKRTGRRIQVALTRRLFRTRMYHGWREIWEGLGRSAFEGTGFSISKVIVGLGVGNVLAALPWAAAASLTFRDLAVGIPLSDDAALLLALGACAVSALVYLPYLLFLRVSPLYVFTLPLACLFYSGVAINSTWISVMGRGVPWKGRHYRPPA